MTGFDGSKATFPNACGDPIKFCVNSVGEFHDDVDEDVKSIEHALSLCFDTLLFGLGAAKRVLLDRVGKPYRPDPMSGMRSMIGTQHVNFPVIANPIPMPEHSLGCGEEGIVASQAEFFCGDLNVQEMLTKSELQDFWYLQFYKADKSVPVLIKVCSMAVNHFLIKPAYAFGAMEDAKAILASPRIPSQGHESPNVEVATVAGPLLAVVQREVGLITIMKDLSKQNYVILRPKELFALGLSALWEGFMDLVIGVLLPLARCDVIHADIRPGYDYTTNILFKTLDGGKVWMELIDFESLVDLVSWNVSPDQIGYIEKRFRWTAITFVWWQCVFVAFAWLEERNLYRVDNSDDYYDYLTKHVFKSNDSDTASAELPMADMRSLKKGITSHKWLPASLHEFASEPRIDESSVMSTLTELEKVFRKRDEYRQQMDKEATLDALARFLEAEKSQK